MRKDILIFIILCALIFSVIAISPLPSSFADGPVTFVQNNFNEGQSSTGAICRLTHPVAAHDSLMITLDAAFINNPISSISDSFGNTFTVFALVLNSATTWAQSWEAQNIATGGSNDNISISYTDSGGRGTYVVTCAEFLGNLNFTQIGGLIVGSASCNTCNLNLTSTLVYNGHNINYFTGWSDSSTNTNLGFTYNALGSFAALAGSDTCQAISGSSNCILAFHSGSNSPSGVGADSGVTVTCSPACSQTPVFALTYYSTCITVCASSTTTLLTTLTVTAWNTIDPGTPISWITLALFLTLIPGLMWGALRGFGARPSATVFFTLVSCFIGSIMGTISGVDLGVNAIVPLGITVFNGIALGLYVILSRQRGNPVT